jgi:predicted metalloprotease
MRWQEGGESENVEDQRSLPVGMALGGAGTVILVVLGLLFGFDPRALIQQQQQQLNQGAPQGAPAQRQDNPEEARKVTFVKHILFMTEQVWSDLFQTQVPRHPAYVKPKLVLFTGRVQSACGLAQTAVGPFYCPGDEKVYIDLEFYDELKNRFHAGGDFANAYVVAHEVGHHVQNLLGISPESKRNKIPRLRNETDNELSVRLELQADFLAGIWAHYADQKWHILEQGDVEKAITAAQAIGDDRLQKQAQGYVVPEKFTHGRSDQRVHWFTEGLKSGNLKEADQLWTQPYNAL